MFPGFYEPLYNEIQMPLEEILDHFKANTLWTAPKVIVFQDKAPE